MADRTMSFSGTDDSPPRPLKTTLASKDMGTDIREPFIKCPKCGHEPNIVSISKSSSMFHYFCPSCGHEEAGTQHFADFELSEPKKDVILTVYWSDVLVSPKELVALKKIDKRFENKKPQEIKRMISFRPNWKIGPIEYWIGQNLYQKGKEHGLNICIKEVD